MQEIIKLYFKSGKIRLVGRSTLTLYRRCPSSLRQAGVYGLYHLRKSRVPKNRFVVFAQGRTGSTLVVDLMNSHPDVFMFGEILDREVIQNVKNPLKWAEGLTTLSKRPTCGFKVKIYQLENAHHQDPAAVLKKFHDSGWKIIYLRRNNLLRHAISDLRSDKTGQFHSVMGNKPKGPIEVTWEELDEAIRFRERALEREEEALSDLPYLLLEYENDLLDEQKQREAMDRVFEYLGLQPHTVSTELKKVTSKDYGKDIANWAELEPKIAASDYAKYLGWG